MLKSLQFKTHNSNPLNYLKITFEWKILKQILTNGVHQTACHTENQISEFAIPHRKLITEIIITTICRK